MKDAVWRAAVRDDDAQVRAAAVRAGVELGIHLDLSDARRDPSSQVRGWAIAAKHDQATARAELSPVVWSICENHWGLDRGALWPTPEPRPSVSQPAFVLRSDVKRVALGRTGLEVSRLGLSGHYGLPKNGFDAALRAGINLFFWEPSYAPQAEFFKALDPRAQDEIVVVAGTFGCSAREVRRDVDRALRLTGLQRIDLFLVFWVRSWERLSNETCSTLDALTDEGKIARWSFSTHQRALAAQGIERGFDPVMVRHNLAHRGAETEVFPVAKAQNTGLLTLATFFTVDSLSRSTVLLRPPPIVTHIRSRSTPSAPRLVRLHLSSNSATTSRL